MAAAKPPANPPSPRQPRIARAVMIVLALLSLVWLGLAVPFYSHPDIDGFVLSLHAAPALLLLAPAWLVASIGIAGWAARLGTPKTPIRLAIVAAVTPVCGLLGVVLVVTDLDMRLRFRLSESQLTREAERVRNLPDRWDNSERWVGLFRVHAAHTDQNDAVHLVTNNTHLFGEAGFIHAPAEPPARDAIHRDQHLTHLYGPWYSYFIID